MNEISNIFELWNKYADRNEGFKSYPVDEHIQKLAALFSPSKYYYFIFNLFDLSIDYASPSIKNILGVPPEEFTMNHLLQIMDPDDLPIVRRNEGFIIKFLDTVDIKDVPFYKFSYFFKVKGPNGEIKQILHQATAVTIVDNAMGHVLDVAIDVTHLNIRDEKKLTILALRDDLKSFYNIDPDKEYPTSLINRDEESLSDLLSERQIEIVRLIAQGSNTKEIAEELSLSEHTIKTHRKNILQKAGCANTAELVSRCLLEGVI